MFAVLEGGVIVRIATAGQGTSAGIDLEVCPFLFCSISEVIIFDFQQKCG
jgi:hypothetical protein